MVDTQTYWNQCLQIFKDNVSAKEYETWFAHIAPLSYENKVLTLQVPSMFVAEVLEDKYIDLLSKAIQRIIGKDTRLQYRAVIDKTSNTTTTIPGETHLVNNTNTILNNRPQLPQIDSQLNNAYSFEALVEGVGNKLARNAGLTIAKAPGKTAFNPLFIYGKSGVGKTHLANAIGLMTKQLNPNARVLYVPAHTFQIQYTDAVRNNRQIDFLNFYQTIDVLIVDDIQEYIGRIATQNTFFHIFNHLHQAGKQLVLTSDRAPMELEGMEERLITRFKWGLTAEIEKPDLELRKNILRNKIRRDGLKFPEDVISYIAEHVNASVRDLEGIIVSLMAHSTINNRDVDLQLAHKIIGGLSEYEKEPISVEKIVKTVAEYYNVDVNSINTKSRKREIVLVRQTAMFLAKKHLDLSTSKIGQQIGRRDHATVLHACKTISNLLDTNKQFRSELNEIESALQTA